MKYRSNRKLIFALCCLTHTSFFRAIENITDISKLTTTQVKTIEHPKTVARLRAVIRQADRPISIAGGRYSQGGQIASTQGIVIDTTKLNRIKKLDVRNKQITVETGITWREIQKYIDPYNLSVKVMQSYNDFTVGGSLSVNVHGRSMEYGQMIETVDSIKILLADGSLTTASRNEHYDLFSAAIGGYGLMGVIVEATLQLTENIKLQQKMEQLTIAEYTNFFFNKIKNDKNVVFHSATLYPNELQNIVSTTYYKTDKTLTITDRMQPYHRFFLKKMIEEQFLRRIQSLKKIRPKIEISRLEKEKVVWRNYEMSYTVRSLEPLCRFPTTSVLQEFFIPVEKLTDFVDKLRMIVNRYNINLINVTIRHVPGNSESLLTYAAQESFAFVLYINILNTKSGQKYAKKWTQQLIDAAIALNGTYYLPYQLYATPKQLRNAYPNFDQLLTCKKEYDPQNKFSNRLLEKYK